MYSFLWLKKFDFCYVKINSKWSIDINFCRNLHMRFFFYRRLKAKLHNLIRLITLMEHFIFKERSMQFYIEFLIFKLNHVMSIIYFKFYYFLYSSILLYNFYSDVILQIFVFQMFPWYTISYINILSLVLRPCL